jgi:GT2 family glycosyltransferase
MAAAAIIIPTLFAGDMLESCLRAVERQTWRDFEVVVVNNGVVAAPVKAWPLRVISPGGNIGFGAAINLGVSVTDAPLIVTLNDDTVPDENWLAELIEEISSDSHTGMCASRIRMLATGRLDSAGMLICLDGSSKQRGGHMPHGAFPVADETLLPSACAAIYRREMLEDIGGFDEDFFLYCEDTDLGLRAQWAGWKCRYAAGAQVEHRYSGSSGAASELKARYVERNRMWVAIKNFPWPMLLATPLFSAVRYLLQCAGSKNSAAGQFFETGNSPWDALGIVARVHLETARHLPVLLRKRAAIRRRIGALEFARILFRHRIGLRALARA